MVALACKLCQVLRVLAGLTTVLLFFRGNTTASGVCAFLGFGHSVLLKLRDHLICFLFAAVVYRLAGRIRALFVDRLDHAVVG
jgi:hypothetical protein